MIGIKILGAVMFTTAVIFGTGSRWKRWLHRRRMARNDRYKKRREEQRRRRFIENLREIDKSWDKPVEKTQKITYKGPAEFAPAWM